MAHDGFYIPDPIYRVLPLIYILTGVLTFYFVTTIMAILSGLLLISAGVLVYLWRSAAKSERRRRAQRARSNRSPGRDPDSLSLSTSGRRGRQH